MKELDILEDEFEMVEMILENYWIIIDNMCEIICSVDKVEDEGIIDMIGGFLVDFEKFSWMFDVWKVKKEVNVIV